MVGVEGGAEVGTGRFGWGWDRLSGRFWSWLPGFWISWNLLIIFGIGATDRWLSFCGDCWVFSSILSIWTEIIESVFHVMGKVIKCILFMLVYSFYCFQIAFLDLSIISSTSTSPYPSLFQYPCPSSYPKYQHSNPKSSNSHCPNCPQPLLQLHPSSHSPSHYPSHCQPQQPQHTTSSTQAVPANTSA